MLAWIVLLVDAIKQVTDYGFLVSRGYEDCNIIYFDGHFVSARLYGKGNDGIKNLIGIAQKEDETN